MALTDAARADAGRADDGETVLVLRDLGLGDALTAVPALRGLRRAHPASTLVLAGPLHLGRWLRTLGVVDEAVACRDRVPSWTGPGPSLAVNLHGRGPESHRALQTLSPGRLLAHRNAEVAHQDGPDWQEDVHEVQRWCALVRADGGPCSPEDLRLDAGPSDHPGCVVLHPGAASPARRWPVQRWADLAGLLAARGLLVVVTGSASEVRLTSAVAAADPRVLDLGGALDLPELAALVGSAALVICGDTGVAHLATATATPSVLLFGPVSPDLWGPLVDQDRHVVLWRPFPEDPPGDPHGDRLDPRLARIDLDTVVAEATGLLDAERLSSLRARSS